MTTDAIIEKKSKTTNNVKEPGKFNVIVCNDNSTPMEFVIAMLISIFRHDERNAIELTLKIHNEEKAIVGTFTHEVAEQKQLDATNLARMNGWPLIIKIAPE
jgi:ATP-dependent Clp protease adaptor protein ClpS